ncbi:MAG: glycosyltransferase [Rikenellaceae bacterium]|nr:glycosyltransferase [Rikenellaceae bacterium]
MVKVSLVIATYNRSRSLLRTLGSLPAQTLDRSLFEVVVVDNNSSDDTREVVGRFAADHPDLRLVYRFEREQGLSPARNSGIAASQGGYIVIIDDDETVNPGFLSSYYYLFENFPDAAAAGGRIVARFETAHPPRWMSHYTERVIAGILDLGPRIRPFTGKAYPGGGNIGFRRSAFDRYGLFDPSLGRRGALLLGGEEKELVGRIRAAGEQVYYVPGAVIYHYIPAERLTKAYFDKVTYMVGVSERTRTKAQGTGAFAGRVLAECVKWAATLVLLAGYTLRFRPAKGWYLVRMRRNVSRGLMGAGPANNR